MPCFSHNNMHLPKAVRFIGKHTTGEQCDPDIIIPKLQCIGPEEECRNLQRILTDGCLAKYNTHSYLQQFMDYYRYGNHPFLNKIMNNTMKVINKDDK